MMPITLLAVDGPSRTFNCVEVTPSAGGIVGLGRGEGGVSDGGCEAVTGRVAVIILGRAVSVEPL